MIYLDNSATTKPCPEAVEAMTKALTEHWGNPSALYGFGIDTAKLLRQARQTVAAAMGSRLTTSSRASMVAVSRFSFINSFSFLVAARRAGRMVYNLIIADNPLGVTTRLEAKMGSLFAPRA